MGSAGAGAHEDRALRRSEELLRLAVQVSGIGIFDHDHVTDTIYWSARQREIYDFGPDEPVTLPDFMRCVHPDDAERIAETVRRAHNPAGDGRWEVEHRIVRRDGSVRWLVARSQTFFKNGRPVRTVGVVIDQTERKQADENLRIKDQAIATSLNAIAIADTVGPIIYVNPAFIRLWRFESEAEVLGRSPLEFAEPESTARVLEALRTQGWFQGELVARRKDGTTFDIMVVANTVRDTQGRVTHMMASFLDLSESRSMQAQLLQAQKMESIGRLAGGVAHDFNNLLTVIKGYLELAVRALNQNDPLRRDLLEVSQAADSATVLTRQLLAFSRRQIIKPQVLDLSQVIGRVQKMLGRLLGEDIELRATCAEGLWRVQFDPGQCEQVLINLAVNARDAMPTGGKLLVEASNVTMDDADGHHPGIVSGDYVLLSVTDTGTGMTDDVKAHIFEPFFTTKAPGVGTGLGLAMVYGAVSQNAGRIEVESEVGKGTTFKIYLTRSQSLAAPAETRERDQLSRGTETIVLVEDDAAVRGLATRLLGNWGYKVHAFADGGSALRAVEGMREPVHLLVTDVVMRDMNGRALAERLRGMRPELRVLFASGYTSDVIELHGVLADGVGFLAKPYSIDSLARRVRQLLDEEPL